MKKNYFAPETEIFNVQVNTNLLAGSGEFDPNSTNPDPEEQGGAAKPRTIRYKDAWSDFDDQMEMSMGDENSSLF